MEEDKKLSDAAEVMLQIPSVRKLRLFLSACCRYLFCDPHGGDADVERKIAEPIERYADGLLAEIHRRWVHRLAMRLDGNGYHAMHKKTALKALTAFFLRPEVVWFHLKAFEGTGDYPPLEVLNAVVVRFARDVIGESGPHDELTASWRTPQVVSLAQRIYADRAFDQMPELGRLLEQAGCQSVEILKHCRRPESHVRGCWVVDFILGKK